MTGFNVGHVHAGVFFIASTHPHTHKHTHTHTLQYTTLYTTLHYTTLHYTTLHYATLRYATLRYATLRYATLHTHTHVHTHVHTHTHITECGAQRVHLLVLLGVKRTEVGVPLQYGRIQPRALLSLLVALKLRGRKEDGDGEGLAGVWKRQRPLQQVNRQRPFHRGQRQCGKGKNSSSMWRRDNGAFQQH